MKLHYKEFGDKTKPTIVILHGLFGSSDNWQTHAKKLSEYFHVSLLDARNHGQSPWSEVFSLEAMSADLKTFVQEQKLEKFTLLGHSMGGKVAMSFAQKFPDLLHKLIIVDIATKAYPPHHQQIFKGLNALLQENLTSRSQADNILAQYVDSVSVRQFLLKNLYRNAETLKFRMNIAVIEREVASVLQAIPDLVCTVPTLFIRGQLSNYILNEDFSDIQKIFPNSNIVTIENAGHWLHADQPEAFLSLVGRQFV